MAVSKICDHCTKVKRCSMHRGNDGDAVYLCVPCARELQYLEKTCQCGHGHASHESANLPGFPTACTGCPCRVYRASLISQKEAAK